MSFLRRPVTLEHVLVPLLSVLLVLAGCGGDNPDEGVSAKKATLADIKVTEGPDKSPQVDFKPPVSFAKTETKVLTKGPGKGDAVRENSQVTVNYLGVNASDGSTFGTTYGDGGQPAIFTANTVVPAFTQAIVGRHAGDRVLVAAAPADAYGASGNGAAIGKNTSIIFVIDVVDVVTPLEEATGAKVQPPAGVPQLHLDKQGHPDKFVATRETPEKVDKLGVYDVIQGTGPEVQSGQTITVHYLGQIYPDGKVFDTSWSDDPVAFPIGTGGVIKGWDEGLVGQKVGSRVILVVPAELGYGKQGQGSDIPPNSDLIFSVDILGAA